MTNKPVELGNDPKSTTETEPRNVDVIDSESGEIELPSDHTDGRDMGEWESRWPAEAKKRISYESVYVGAMLLASLGGVILSWNGVLSDTLCADCDGSVVRKYGYYFFGGMLGGSLFAVKFLYKVVARGYWNADRILWRIFSPVTSASMAFALGALIDAGLFGLTTKSDSGATYLGIGFIVGYFADSALAKMAEIAEVIFGTTSKRFVSTSNPKDDS